MSMSRVPLPRIEKKQNKNMLKFRRKTQSERKDSENINSSQSLIVGRSNKGRRYNSNISLKKEEAIDKRKKLKSRDQYLKRKIDRIYETHVSLMENDNYEKYYEKKEREKIQRVISALKEPDREHKNRKNKSGDLKRKRLFHQSSSRIRKMKKRDTERFENLLVEYHKLSQEKDPRSETNILEFVKTLTPINTFLAKLSHLMIVPLFRIGKIRIVPEGKYLYSQDDPFKSFFLILWGEFKLKTSTEKNIKYCISGETLREEIILQIKKPITNRQFCISNLDGNRRCRESAKSMVISAVLEIKQKKYEKFRKEAAEIGANREFNLIDKLLMWCFTKKSKFYQGSSGH